MLLDCKYLFDVRSILFELSLFCFLLFFLFWLNSRAFEYLMISILSLYALVKYVFRSSVLPAPLIPIMHLNRSILSSYSIFFSDNTTLFDLKFTVIC